MAGLSYEWCLPPVILELGRPRQDNGKFKASLGCIARWCLKNNTRLEMRLTWENACSVCRKPWVSFSTPHKQVMLLYPNPRRWRQMIRSSKPSQLYGNYEVGLGYRGHGTLYTIRDTDLLSRNPRQYEFQHHHHYHCHCYHHHCHSPTMTTMKDWWFKRKKLKVDSKVQISGYRVGSVIKSTCYTIMKMENRSQNPGNKQVSHAHL